MALAGNANALAMRVGLILHAFSACARNVPPLHAVVSPRIAYL